MSALSCLAAFQFTLLGLLFYSVSTQQIEIVVTQQSCDYPNDRRVYPLSNGDDTKYMRCGATKTFWILPCRQGTQFSAHALSCVPKPVPVTDSSTPVMGTASKPLITSFVSSGSAVLRHPTSERLLQRVPADRNPNRSGQQQLLLIPMKPIEVVSVETGNSGKIGLTGSGNQVPEKQLFHANNQRNFFPHQFSTSANVGYPAMDLPGSGFYNPENGRYPFGSPSHGFPPSPGVPGNPNPAGGMPLSPLDPRFQGYFDTRQLVYSGHKESATFGSPTDFGSGVVEPKTSSITDHREAAVAHGGVPPSSNGDRMSMAEQQRFLQLQRQKQIWEQEYQQYLRQQQSSQQLSQLSPQLEQLSEPLFREEANNRHSSATHAGEGSSFGHLFSPPPKPRPPPVTLPYPRYPSPSDPPPFRPNMFPGTWPMPRSPQFPGTNEQQQFSGQQQFPFPGQQQQQNQFPWVGSITGANPPVNPMESRVDNMNSGTQSSTFFSENQESMDRKPGGQPESSWQGNTFTRTPTTNRPTIASSRRTRSTTRPPGRRTTTPKTTPPPPRLPPPPPRPPNLPTVDLGQVPPNFIPRGGFYNIYSSSRENTGQSSFATSELEAEFYQQQQQQQQYQLNQNPQPKPVKQVIEQRVVQPVLRPHPTGSRPDNDLSTLPQSGTVGINPVDTRYPVEVQKDCEEGGPCGHDPERELFCPFPSDGRKYFQCSPSGWMERECPGGLHFAGDHCDSAGSRNALAVPFGLVNKGRTKKPSPKGPGSGLSYNPPSQAFPSGMPVPFPAEKSGLTGFEEGKYPILEGWSGGSGPDGQGTGNGGNEGRPMLWIPVQVDQNGNPLPNQELPPGFQQQMSGQTGFPQPPLMNGWRNQSPDYEEERNKKLDKQ